MMQYYYTDGKERFGPFSVEEMKNHPITPQTLVWKEGLPDWVPANTLSDLNVLFAEVIQETEPASVSRPAQSMALAPKNWLIESVLVTIFCCLPIGIVGIILALLVDSMWKEGHYAAAQRLSEEAGRWVKYGVILGFIVMILYLLFISSGIMNGISGGVPV